MQFKDAERLFRAEQIRELAASQAGRRYLKLRSLSRRDYMEGLLDGLGLPPSIASVRGMFEEIYNRAISEEQIDAFIKRAYRDERAQRRAKEASLVNELYRMEVFDWGGLHQNSLEKTIVDNYVKKIWKFDVLEEKIDGELHNSQRGYVLCSWYNHWTSILIEDVFRDHPNVLPAVGQVKKIDFFIKRTPFDLKVTYLPEGYIVEKRRADGQQPELTVFRREARRLGVPFDSTLASGKLLEDLWKKLSDHPAGEAQAAVADAKAKRKDIIDSVMRDPTDLIRWLYENQGVRRFDASNRLFLVLVDTEDFFGSWKLKRALPRLQSSINAYLDAVTGEPGQEVEFRWEGDVYTARSDVVVVKKP